MSWHSTKRAIAALAALLGLLALVAEAGLGRGFRPPPPKPYVFEPAGRPSAFSVLRPGMPPATFSVPRGGKLPAKEVLRLSQLSPLAQRTEMAVRYDDPIPAAVLATGGAATRRAATDHGLAVDAVQFGVLERLLDAPSVAGPAADALGLPPNARAADPSLVEAAVEEIRVSANAHDERLLFLVGTASSSGARS